MRQPIRSPLTGMAGLVRVSWLHEQCLPGLVVQVVWISVRQREHSIWWTVDCKYVFSVNKLLESIHKCASCFFKLLTFRRVNKMHFLAVRQYKRFFITWCYKYTSKSLLICMSLFWTCWNWIVCLVALVLLAFKIFSLYRPDVSDHGIRSFVQRSDIAQKYSPGIHRSAITKLSNIFSAYLCCS